MQRVVLRGLRSRATRLKKTTPSIALQPASSGGNINNMAFQMRNAAAKGYCTSRICQTDATEKKEGDDVPEEKATSGEAEEAGKDEASEESPEARIFELEKEVKEMKDKVLRSMAEEENVRRIAKKDVENANAYAITKFAKALLDVSDNFERAINAIPAEKLESLESGEGDPLFKSFVEGIVAVDKGMMKTFNQFGVTKYGEVGDKFDPELHDALFQIPDASKEEGTIGQVVKTGFKLKDRVIRAAQCGIIKAP